MTSLHEQSQARSPAADRSHRGMLLAKAAHTIAAQVAMRRPWRTYLIFGTPILVALALAVAWAVRGRLTGQATDQVTFTARRASLIVSVTESGDIKARTAVDVRSQVERRTTIISLIPEGTYVTEEDVKKGTILVELDDSELKESVTQQEVTFASTKASLAEALEEFQIQKNQNDSDINKGEMTVRFCEMDLEKYLGKPLAKKLVDMSNKNDNPGKQIVEPASTQPQGAGQQISEASELQIDTAEEDLIDNIGQWVTSPELKGAALQRREELETQIDLADEEVNRAKDRLRWTTKLREKDYVSEDELKADQLASKRREVEVQQAKRSLELFNRYDFPKEAAKFYSDYKEADRELERIRARARSRLAQAEANLKGKQATHRLQKDRLNKLRKQLDACVIRATAPGQVVYASSSDRWSRRNQPIEVGAEVQYRMHILEVPNTAAMKVETKVHETWVEKVHAGLEAKITVDAFPDETFSGKVLKVAPLADSQRWWSNPDLKVYSTEVSIEETDGRLRTGMSAKVEIVIKELPDVLVVPVETVVNRSGKKLVYVDTPDGPEAREVETGDFNDDFIQIVSGLDAGKKVLLTPPRLADETRKDINEEQGSADAADTETARTQETSSARDERTGE